MIIHKDKIEALKKKRDKQNLSLINGKFSIRKKGKIKQNMGMYLNNY